MANKRSQAFVSATQTGDATGDGRGQGIQWQNKGGRNATTESSRRGAGQVAPRPKHSKSAFMASSAHTAPVQASMARVKNSGGAPAAGNFLPVQKPPAGLQGGAVGQPNPNTAAGATTKPKRKGLGSAFYGE